MSDIKKIIFSGFLLLALISPYSVYAESKLSWDAPATGGNVDSYRLYWRTAGSVYSVENRVIGISNAEYSFNSLGSLQEKATYYFVVRAYNATGESENSNEVSWTVPDTTAPSTVQGISVL